jgi:hypothetical protein
MKKYAYISLLVLLAGCNGGEKSTYKPVQKKDPEPAVLNPGQEATIFPFTVGNSWTYRVQIAASVGGQGLPADQREITMKVTEVTPTPDGVRATIDIIEKEEVKDRQIWALNKIGLYQVAIGKDKPVYTLPPQPVVLFPAKEDETFSWKGWGLSALGRPGNTESSSKILGSQVVDTLVGQMSAIAIETESKITTPAGSGDVRANYYWAPKVGLVRYRQETLSSVTPPQKDAQPQEVRSVTMMELKSFTVK